MKINIGMSVLVVSLLGGCGTNTQVSPSVLRHVEKLREFNRVESSAVYESGQPSEVYAVYEKMLALSSEQELCLLLEDRTPAVRVYALWGLKDKFPQKDLFPIVLAHLSDDIKVDTLFGCIGDRMKVADLMLDTIHDGLTDKQREKLLNWMLEHPNSLRARQEALRSWDLGPQHHDAVRRLASDGVEGALEALASYHDPSDVPVILKTLNSGSDDPFRAIQRFPHPAFFSAMQAMLREGRVPGRQDFYLAVAAYQTVQAREILLSPFKMPADDHYLDSPTQFAFKAAIQFKCDVYVPALLVMWENQPIPFLPYTGPSEGPFPEDNLVDMLFKADPKRTLQVIEKQFSRKDFNQQTETAVSTMCRVLLREMKSDQAFEIINQGLRHCYTEQIDVITKLVIRYKPDSAIPVLFEILTTTDNGNMQVPVARAILAYGRKDLEERIEKLAAAGKIPANDWGRDAVLRLVRDPE